MENRFNESDSTDQIESSEGPRGKPRFKFFKELAPGGMLDSRVNESGTQVFVRERSNRKPKNASDVSLGERRSVEEKNLRFRIIDG